MAVTIAALSIPAQATDMDSDGESVQRKEKPDYSRAAWTAPYRFEAMYAENDPVTIREPQTVSQQDSKEGKLSARYRLKPLNTELDIFWRENSHRLGEAGDSPGLDLGRVGFDYGLTSPDSVRQLGASLGTTLRRSNLSSEIKVRHNTSLLDLSPGPSAGSGADSRNKFVYLVGNSVHVQFSTSYTLPRTVLWDSASLRFEAGRQRLTSVTRNAAAIDPGPNRQARAIQAVFTPTWFEALPNLNLSLPISLTYSPSPQSPLPGFNGTYKGGRFSIGAAAQYDKVWHADLRYIKYLGAPTSEVFRDKNFLWLSVQRSF